MFPLLRTQLQKNAHLFPEETDKSVTISLRSFLKYSEGSVIILPKKPMFHAFPLMKL